MKRTRPQGLTLIEMLFSITIMMILLAAAHATIGQSMKLHKGSFRDSARITQRCDLAEQLTADFRMNLGVSEATSTKWILTRADGRSVEYRVEGEKVIRTSTSGEKKARRSYDIGKVKVSFLTKRSKWSDTPARGEEPLALRLRFSRAELIVAK